MSGEENHPAEGREFARELETHLLEHILPFWCGPALDHERGGWMAWLANDLTPDRSRPKGLIVHSRILWTFSAAYRMFGMSQHAAMARRAYDYLMAHFCDPLWGGGFWQLNDHGEVIDDSKKTYGQAFLVYGLSEFYLTFGEPAALQKARETFELIERAAHDFAFGGYIEVCNRDWTEAGAGARLSDKDQAEKKSMNNQLHVLEAYANFWRASKDSRARERLVELISVFLERILDPRHGHLNHFFDGRWHVRSNSYTFGHDIEASWLLCEAAEATGDGALLKQVQARALKLAHKTLIEGLTTDGALVYEGRDGRILDPGRECWPQAEAMIGFVNAWQLTNDPVYLRAARAVWDHARKFLVDRTHGEWFWKVDAQGRPDQSLPKVSEWKGPYHVSRACMEIKKRLGDTRDAHKAVS